MALIDSIFNVVVFLAGGFVILHTYYLVLRLLRQMSRLNEQIEEREIARLRSLEQMRIEVDALLRQRKSLDQEILECNTQLYNMKVN